MRRLLLLILGFLATWLGATVPAVAAAELPTHPELVHAYTYDTVGAAAPDAMNERRPPTGDYTARYAADHGSCGASACQYASTAPVTYRYDHPIKLAQVAHDAGTIERSDGVAQGAPAVVDRGRVAANTGPKALNAASRVSPWAGPSLSRLTREGEVMYRVWGGGADKAGSWLTPTNPISSAAARQGLALPAENAALYVSKVTLPAGVRVQVGAAGPAFGQPGGWAQMQLLERIPLSSFGKGVPLQ